MLKSIYRTIISISISIALVALIFRLISTDNNQISITSVLSAIKAASVLQVALYFVCQCFQTIFRTIRTQLLLNASKFKIKTIPLLLITLVRSAFVDMLPARIGELCYITMLKKGCDVNIAVGVSSLSVSILFDFIGLLFVLAISLPLATNQYVLLPYVIALIFLTVLGFFILFFLAPVIGSLLKKLSQKVSSKYIKNGLKFFHDITDSISLIRNQKCLSKVLILSILIRVAKYLGLLILFYAVATPLFSSGRVSTIPQTLSALIGAEGATTLPIPSFMSFGTYEAGGLSIFKIMGFDSSSLPSIAIIIFAMHIISQIIDYSMGSIALIAFFWNTKSDSLSTKKQQHKLIKILSYIFIITFTLLFLFTSYRTYKKQGSLSPPTKGKEIYPSRNDFISTNNSLSRISGKLVWSSSRDGLHNLYMMELPCGKVSTLTQSNFTDTYPRFSPDGTKVLFSRSTEPWVSLRNMQKWNTYIIDIASRKEFLVATNAFMASWHPNGNDIIFSRNNASQLIKASLNITDSDVSIISEEILLESGKSPIPNGTQITLADINNTDPYLLVTLRGRVNYTATIYKNNELRKIDSGCQTVWRKSNSTEFAYINHPGKQKNTIFFADAISLEKEPFYDAPSDYSHEYFPSFSNDGEWLAYGASTGAHEQDIEDYEIFVINVSSKESTRLTFNTSNDSWPTLHIDNPNE